VRVRVFGPTVVTVDGGEVAVTPVDSAVLATLVNFVECDKDTLGEYAWRQSPTDRAVNAAVYRLRRALGQAAIERRGDVLSLGRSIGSDLAEFSGLLGGTVCDPAMLRVALDLVTGEPFASLKEHPAWVPIRRRWGERVEGVRDALIDDMLARGDVIAALAATRQQVERNPTATRQIGRLVRLLFDSGRSVEAMRELERASHSFRSRGVDMPRSLVEMERALLKSSAGPSLLPARSGRLYGRDREERVLRSLIFGSTGLRTVRVTGPGGVGKSAIVELLSAAARDAMWVVCISRGDPVQRDAVAAFDALGALLSPGGGAVGENIAALGDLVARATRQVLWVIDDAHWAPRLLEAALSLARRFPDRLVVVAAQRSAPSAAEGLFVCDVPLVGLDPTAVGDWLSDSRVDHDVDALIAATGGEPGRVAAAVEEFRLGGVIDVRSIVKARFNGLTPASRTAIAVLASLGVPVHPAALLQSGVDQVSIAELLAQRWLIVADDRRLVLAHSCLAVVTEFGWLDDVLLCAVADLVPAERRPSEQLRRAEAIALGGPGRVDRVAHHALVACELAESASPEQFVSYCEEAAAIARTAPGFSPEAAMRIKIWLGSALRSVGRVEKGSDELWAAYSAALEAGSVDAAAFAAAAFTNPSVVTSAGMKAEAESLLQRFVDDPELGEFTAVRVAAAHAYHQLDRRSVEVGTTLAREAHRRAAALGPLDEFHVLRNLVAELSYPRTLRDEARRLFRLAVQHGNLSAATSALVYEVCADMRTQQTTFEDPRLDELAAIATSSGNEVVKNRWAGVAVAQAMLAHDVVRVAEIHADVLGRNSGSGEALPFFNRVFGLHTTLASQSNWIELDPAALAGHPTHPSLIVEDDKPIDEAVVAFCRNDSHAAAAALLQMRIGFERQQPAPLAVTRLPAAATLAIRLGDPQVARHVLDLSRQLSGHDLCQLPIVHLGPADVWLSMLAELADDPELGVFRERASRRVAALHATVFPPPITT